MMAYLQKKLWDFCWELAVMESSIGMSLGALEPFNPEATLANIEKVKETLRKLHGWCHVDYLDEPTFNMMCEQLDALSRRIYVSYASCKATGARELYVESLRSLFGEVRNVVSPIVKERKNADRR